MGAPKTKLAFLLASAALAACGGSKAGGTQGQSAGSVRVTGVMQGLVGPVSAGVPVRIAAPAPPADTLLAVPMDRGSLWGQLMSRSVSASLSSGTFSIDLSKDLDWVLLLVDSTSSGPGRFRGAVNLRTALDGGLIDLPVSRAAVDALAVGTVATSLGGDAVTAAAVDAATFQLTPAQLEALAKADDLFKNAKNLVNNFGAYGNGAGVWYQLRPDFTWDGEADVSSAFSDPAGLAYRGMGFQLDTSSTSATMDPICSHSLVVSLEPPAVVTIDTGAGPTGYGPGVPFSSASATCTTIVRNDSSPGQEFWSGSLYGTDGYGGMSYSLGVQIPTNPAGLWTWREDGTVRAAFDVSGVNPPVDGGKAAGFVPSFKVNVAADGRITSVDVRWFTYDRGAGTYALLAAQDLPALRAFIGSAEVKFDRTYGGQRETEELYFDPVTTTRVIPAKTWYYGLHPADPGAETGLMGFYETGGFGFFFDFRPALTP